MAKRVVAEYYTFSPSTKTITIPNRIIPREQLLLVVNQSSNTVLYNFSDPDLNITSYTCPYSSTGTQFTVNYDTSSMSAADPIMIMEDQADQTVTVSEIMQDPTNKIRVAAPQSLIDTDFEYGLQPIKWESLATIQNYPSYFYRGGANTLPVLTVVGGNQAPRSTMTVTTTIPHGLNTSDLVNVSYTNNFDGEGAYPILTVPSATTFTYTAKAQINGNIANSSTNIQGGGLFTDRSNAPARVIVSSIASDNAAASPGSIITVTTTGKHGLLRGSPILVNSATTTTINGSWSIFDVPSATTFRFQTPGVQTGTATPTIGNMIILMRPEANFVHRPSDGGVMINTVNVQEGIMAARQSRRYFRYQSGKGIQMSTGTKFTPSFDINTISSTTAVCAITTQQYLSIASGTTIVVEGIEVNAGTTNTYNGTFTTNFVSSASKTLTYTMGGTPTDTNPGGVGQVTVKNWKGASNRVGMFDMQNGFYFEYDGTTMFAVRRNSTREIPGTINVVSGSTTVTGINTKFHKNLVTGDYVVIRGQNYQVTQIDSATSMEIAPPYRAPSVSGIRCNITTNVKTPQSQWNLDRCDGTGPSGYVLDVTKMQMCYIDYTWYGAGFVRFGFRMTDGNVVYCHKVANNNINNQAYMRSGNLPVRYEVTNIGPYTKLMSGSVSSYGVSLASGDTTMVVKDAEYWPSSGEIMVQQGASVEVMAYGAKTYNAALNAWNLIGLDRRAFGGSTSNLTFVPNEFEGGTTNTSSQCSVSFITCTCAPMIMHWGTSVIMDGGYDDDRSIVFSYGKRRETTVNANTSIAILSIRLAPSVDNSNVGEFGVREIINRMQLKLTSIGTNSTGPMLITGVLNPTRYTGAGAPVIPDTWSFTSVLSSIGAGSLAQVIDHTSNNTTIQGGEQIFSFFADTGVQTYELDEVRDLGNGMLGGDGSNTTPGFPNGPDVLVLVANSVTTSNTILRGLRVSWTEAQA
jgi:hypothetical protein